MWYHEGYLFYANEIHLKFLTKENQWEIQHFQENINQQEIYATNQKYVDKKRLPRDIFLCHKQVLTVSIFSLGVI